MQQVKKLKYRQIDFDKYNLCVANAINSRFEAFSWYLDIVTDKSWEVLVLNDYQAVLPLPKFRIKKRFLKKMVAQPLFCQQLGVFYHKSNDVNLLLENLKKETVFQYHFNWNTIFVSDYFKSKIKKRNNYILDLNKSYSELKKQYKKGLKQNLKNADKASLYIQKNVSFTDFKKLKKENSFHKITKKSFRIIKSLTSTIQQKNKGNFYGVFKENKLISIAFYIQTERHIIYLFSATSPLGKKTGAASFLMDYMIQNNCNQPKILDFEGSSIAGIAGFFKNFGAVNQPFFVYSNR